MATNFDVTKTNTKFWALKILDLNVNQFESNNNNSRQEKKKIKIYSLKSIEILDYDNIKRETF